MAYSTPASLSSGNTLPAAHMNLLRSDFEEVAKPPQIQAYNTAGQSIPNNTLTLLTLQATYSIRNLSIASSVVTVSEAGMYLAVVNVDWALNATGLRYLAVLINGAVSREDHKLPNASFVTGHNMPYIFTVGPGDTVNVNVYQNSGGALTINSGGRLSLCMMSR